MTAGPVRGAGDGRERRNAAALAEWRLGAGRGARNGHAHARHRRRRGLVLDGRSTAGWAELGHVVVSADGPPCRTAPGAVTSRRSPPALPRTARREASGEGANAERLVGLAEEGDGEAEALTEIGRLLGAAIGSFVNIFARDRRHRRRLRRRRRDPPAGARGCAPRGAARSDAVPHIVNAELGTDAGLIGAGLLAFETLER